MCAIHLQYRFPTKTLQSGTPNIFAHFSFKMWWSLMRTHFMPKIFLILSYKNLLIAADAGPFWKKNCWLIEKRPQKGPSSRNHIVMYCLHKRGKAVSWCFWSTYLIAKVVWDVQKSLSLQLFFWRLQRCPDCNCLQRDYPNKGTHELVPQLLDEWKVRVARCRRSN